VIINIFSDSHLTHHVNKNKYAQIEKIASTCDKVIICGDFWDYYRTTFDKFMNSSYRDLFPLLKAKNCTYILGNHDKGEYSDERIYSFCNSAVEKLKREIGAYKFIFMHGHTIAPPPQLGLPLLGEKLNNNLLFFVQVVGHAVFPKISFEYVYKPFNAKMKKWKMDNLPENNFLVTGHSHYKEVDWTNNFANCGMNHLGSFSYIQIDTEASGQDLIQVKGRS
jgi:predicted phosphodiesterase